MADGPIQITPASAENRAVALLDALALEDEAIAKAWSDPESKLLMLHGIRIGVSAVFDALSQAASGQAT